ncbi:uncharacterized protein LOC113874561 [Abrus precatorius]|uniref:Uncharacterized protein LOC113874561 n=1 Tax=Abrus precatorius TaxID=3816 RepID=A0A8B8MLU6_ABRPR|nr:uncharacterized protein LOC113874561 [Abrus precatorius]
MAIIELHPEQLDIGEHVIGHQSRIQEVKSLLDIESSNTVYMVGIHGTGGIGKTTLAKALYNLTFNQFECAIFLEGVRETSSNMGLVHLQEAILSKLLEGKTIRFGSVDEGAARLKERLRNRRILLVLDDIDSVEQLEKLAGKSNWFGSGSRIIITTRDKHVLAVHDVEKRYEMKELNDDEALQLFSWKAFKMSQPPINYEDVSNRAVGYAKGLPLALKVIGSNLVRKSVQECEYALKQYERIPERKIQDILKVSYDYLSEIAQYVFLDIACFFKGESMEYVERILEKCDFYPTYNIGILVDKSLLTVDQYGHLRMHDLVQDMGKEVVRQEAPRKPGERSRLCFQEDVIRVLKENSGSSNIEGIILDPPKKEEVKVDWSGFAFEKMNNLRILIVRNACFSSPPSYLPDSLRLLEWKGYPSESLPQNFYPWNNAVVLGLSHSDFRLEKDKPFPGLVHLTDIDFSFCRFITHVPDMSGVPNLTSLNVSGCENLIAIHHSVGFLKKLEDLEASYCNSLKNLPPTIWLPSLQRLNFNYSRSIENFPDINGVMDKLLKLDLQDTQIKELPHSVNNLTGLKKLTLTSCGRLGELPNSLFMLPKIEEFYIVRCHKVRESFRKFQNSHVINGQYSPLRRLTCINCGLTDEDLHFLLTFFPNLEMLMVPCNKFVFVPTRIKECVNLNFLDVSFSPKLQEIPELPPSIYRIFARRCPSLTSETSRMLWSKALKEVNFLYISMPETLIPEWFDHRCEGGTVSFWTRGKFPVVALAFLYKDIPKDKLFLSDVMADPFHLELNINGLKVKIARFDYTVKYRSGDEEGDQVVVCDVRSKIDAEMWPTLDSLLVSEWNYVEFKCNLPVSYCGVYVYKHETNVDDIKFTCPTQSIEAETPSIIYQKSVQESSSQKVEEEKTTKKARRKSVLNFIFRKKNLQGAIINLYTNIYPTLLNALALVLFIMATHEFNCCHDVFLSFTGQDTRHTFTGHLYDALRRKGINTFIDENGLEGGDQISESLNQAIEESRISVVVLSANYAFSKWCLNELVKIVECRETKNQLVWPVFYKVEPSDVRHQRNSYGKAMDEHENRFGKKSELVQKWRSALSQVANLKGWHFESGYEYQFIQKIVEMAVVKLHRQQLDVGQHVIGHHSRIEEVMSLLDIESSEKVCMVGIHGTGGIGKTTLAKALYNLIADKFKCAVFLEGVRERSNKIGLVNLQETILSKLLEGMSINLGSVDEGAARLKERLSHRRVLLVLDDVDNAVQLEKLAGKCSWYGQGSRIIITTRDKHVLNVHEVEKRYEMNVLSKHEALQLFCLKAFKMSQPATNYEDVSNRAVQYAKGLPLALEVIGSNLVSKSVKECECALEQYERIPERKIHDILRVSYDSLPENAQHIFLDIACFFKGNRRDHIEKILDRCDFYPTYNIGILIDKSLLTVEEHNCLTMHDLIQDMGKEVVRQEALNTPGVRSRLYNQEDVLRVLTENSGSSNIEGIILDPLEKKEIEIEWGGTAFENMNNLRILILRNARFSSAPNYLPNSLRLLEWNGYPSASLPPGFYPRNAVVLGLPYSQLKLDKREPFLRLKHLTSLNFSSCEFITHVPDVSIEFFPNIEGVMDKLSFIDLGHTQIEELPHSVENFTGLETVHMPYCSRLRNLPSGLFMLPKITELYLRDSDKVRESFRRFQNSLVLATNGNLNQPLYSTLRRLSCRNCDLTDEDLHFILNCFPNLEELLVPWNYFLSLPTCIKECSNLTVLDVTHSMDLEEIPELPPSIQRVLARGCVFLTSETSRMLWSQAFNEVYKLHVVMPKTQIPNWFDHRCKGGIVSFWVREKFPVVALAFLLDKVPPSPTEYIRASSYQIAVRLYINGVEVDNFCDKTDYWSTIESDHMILCDVRSQIDVEEWPILDTLLVSEWNYVELKCHLPYEDWNVSYCGAHVYKQETNVDNIHFTCPNPLKRSLSASHNPPKKRLRKLMPKSSRRKNHAKEINSVPNFAFRQKNENGISDE